MNNPIEISENSDAVRSRVESAIEFHNKHFLVPIDQLKLEQMLMQDEAKAMLSECAQKHNMSMRGIAKIAKVGYCEFVCEDSYAYCRSFDVSH